MAGPGESPARRSCPWWIQVLLWLQITFGAAALVLAVLVSVRERPDLLSGHGWNGALFPLLSVLTGVVALRMLRRGVRVTAVCVLGLPMLTHVLALAITAPTMGFPARRLLAPQAMERPRPTPALTNWADEVALTVAALALVIAVLAAIATSDVAPPDTRPLSWLQIGFGAAAIVINVVAFRLSDWVAPLGVTREEPALFGALALVTGIMALPIARRIPRWTRIAVGTALLLLTVLFVAGPLVGPEHVNGFFFSGDEAARMGLAGDLMGAAYRLALLALGLAVLMTNPNSSPRLNCFSAGLMRTIMPNGLTAWRKTGSRPGYTSGMFATRDLRRVLVYSLNPTGNKDGAEFPTVLKIAAATLDPDFTG